MKNHEKLTKEANDTYLYLKDHEGLIPNRPIEFTNTESLILRNPEHYNGRKVLIISKRLKLYYGEISSVGPHDTNGICIFQDGAYYLGNFKDGKIQGEGTLKKMDKNNLIMSYEGDWLDGKPHGFGKEFILNSGVYKGQFVNGIKHGKGKLILDDQSVYDGQFKNNEVNGQGTFIVKKPNKHQFQGNWQNGYLNGQGKHKVYKNTGEILGQFQGQFLNGCKHGQGRYKWGEKKQYIGTFKLNQMNGKGTLRMGKNVYQGQWQKGVEKEIVRRQELPTSYMQLKR